ncbi:ATP-dependent DNA ligase [Modestobacter altitudinis]|uniref:ATP-dependent DNA ligase n=1 Tax=Modestobacter altitudinis TaxID=2213158 RepID=UPI001FE97805|nr:ATP-dependent DNA ligase [Modestobacter altitudinis]
MAAVPSQLRGPVVVALARAERDIPHPGALPGGCLYEPKWDGYRLVIVRSKQAVRLWSKQGKDLSARFPDIAAAAREHLPAGAVVDGEVVIWNGSRLDFDLLQQRMVTSPSKVAALVAAHPASYVAFDLLAAGGEDLRALPLTERRKQLEHVTPWMPPLQLSPVTSDREEARGWFIAYRPAGVEGLVVKGAAGRYAGGRRNWVKVKSRETTEVIVGGVIGTLKAPRQVVAGRVQAGELVMVGRSTVLSSVQAAQLAPLLSEAGAEHPWPTMIGSGRFGGGRDRVPLTRVDPTVIIEVSADTGLQAGAFRHPLRFVRVRHDLGPDDLDD